MFIEVSVSILSNPGKEERLWAAKGALSTLKSRSFVACK